MPKNELPDINWLISGILSHSDIFQSIVKCMSVQFDVVVKDRQLILYKLSQLQNAIPHRQVLSWQFFVQHLQQLFVEAELSCTDDNNRGNPPPSPHHTIVIAYHHN